MYRLCIILGWSFDAKRTIIKMPLLLLSAGVCGADVTRLSSPVCDLHSAHETTCVADENKLCGKPPQYAPPLQVDH